MLELAPRALRDAERHSRWWKENRSRAPSLFDDELRAALDQIRSAPEAGIIYQALLGREHRRVLMPGTRYPAFQMATMRTRSSAARLWGDTFPIPD